MKKTFLLLFFGSLLAMVVLFFSANFQLFFKERGISLPGNIALCHTGEFHEDGSPVRTREGYLPERTIFFHSYGPSCDAREYQKDKRETSLGIVAIFSASFVMVGFIVLRKRNKKTRSLSQEK